MNPSRTADQRRMPTFSPNRGIDRATTKNGETNIIEFVSAKPIYPIAVKKRHVQVSKSNPLPIISFGLFTLSKGIIFLPGNRTSINNRCIINLPQTTIATGRSSLTSFTTVSEVTKRKPASTAKLIPVRTGFSLSLKMPIKWVNVLRWFNSNSNTFTRSVWHKENQ